MIKKDKYRIIKHQDQEGVTFYTVQYQFEWLLGLKFWRTLEQDHRPRMFDTLEDAQKFTRGSVWTHIVVEEGEVPGGN